MVNIYRLELKSKNGWITPLQADTIWGHLCWQILYNQGEDKLKKFLKDFAKKPSFVISHGFTGKVLPKPLYEEDFDLRDYEKEKYKNLNKYQKLKIWSKTKFITTKEFKKYYYDRNEKEKENDIENDIENLKNIYYEKYRNSEDENDKQKQFDIETRGKNQINRRSLTAKENYFQNIKTTNKSIYIYIKILDGDEAEKYDVINTTGNTIKVGKNLKNVFQYGFGKKKSTGLGHFELLEIEKIKEEKQNTDKAILLSNFIPSSKDWEDYKDNKNILYRSFVKYPKYGETGNQDNKIAKPPLQFIKLGATINNFDKDKDYTGKMVELENGRYQYGYGFTFRF